MKKLLTSFDGITYSAMRIVLAFLYWSHGVNWLFGVFGGKPAAAFTLVWSAGVIETFCGTLMLLGLWTSPAAFVASGEMAVAYFMVHFPRAHVPIRNGGEITVALCFVFLFLATHGSGAISVDRLRGKK
ncbi:MAG TPA: DoxX family protein [Vicinamibacterales bacterium]|nr:DoxX family protein [Vicinamibacterales bacterium]